MNCDVCNAVIGEIDNRRISAERFRHLLDRGFGINETNIQMLTEVGVSRSQAISLLLEQYRDLNLIGFFAQYASSRLKVI